MQTMVKMNGAYESVQDCRPFALCDVTSFLQALHGHELIDQCHKQGAAQIHMVYVHRMLIAVMIFTTI